MSCLLQHPPRLPLFHQYYSHHYNPSPRFHYVAEMDPADQAEQGQERDRGLSDSFLLQTLRAGFPGPPSRDFAATGPTETACHFASCPADCENQSHVVILRPIGSYEQQRRDEEPAGRPLKHEPYYEEEGGYGGAQLTSLDPAPAPYGNEVLSLEARTAPDSYHGGDQYRGFRSPPSPPDSSVTSCSSSTLSLLSLLPSTPTRRHSFSTAAVSRTASTSLTSLALVNIEENAAAGPSSSSNYRQRSYTYSNSTPKGPHPYPLAKRLSAGFPAAGTQQNEGRLTEGARPGSRTSNHEPGTPDLDPDHDLSGGSDGSPESGGRKGSLEEAPSGAPAAADPNGFLFMGPVGKKRKMVRERQQSVEADGECCSEDASPEEDLSPASPRPPKPDVPDIAEEEEGEDEEPLDLCTGRVKSLNLNCRAQGLGGALSPPGSVLREQLLGGGLGSPPYRDRSSSISSASLASPQTPDGPGTGPSGKKKLQCPDCGKEFSQLRNFRYHRSRHEGTSQFACTCPICGKQFNDKGYLSSHLKIHRNAKEYQCEWCEKSFNQRVAYNMHVRIHTGLKPHKCTMCAKAFSRKMLLRQHLRTHTGERPYSCEVCGKAFADRSNMLLHQRLHSGQRPYKCDQCGKSFSKNHHLKTHLNHHAGIKPYQCEKCKACFSQSSNMKTHFKKCTGTPSAAAAAANAVLVGGGAAFMGGAGPSRPAYNSGPPHTLLSSSYPPFGSSPPNMGRGPGGAQTRGPSAADMQAALSLSISRVRSSSPPPAGSGSARPRPPITLAQYHHNEPLLAANSLLMFQQAGGRFLFPANLIGPPLPGAASLPLNFELNTLRSRNLPFPPRGPPLPPYPSPPWPNSGPTANRHALYSPRTDHQ